MNQGLNLNDAFTTVLSYVGNLIGYDTNQRNPDLIIATIIGLVISFIGVLFLGLMIYGGYTWMTAAGNEDKVVKAQNLIKAAIIGLAVVTAAYMITYFVFIKVVATGITN